MQKLGYPTTCPHGNAIPGSGKSQPQGDRLGDCASGAIVNVVRIVEKAEENRELLSKFFEYGLTPGATIHVIRREEIPHHDVEIHFRVGNHSCMLTKSMARWIVIAPIDE
jgi:DtxR family Mn-dependent transcriptional regulator